MLAGFGTDGGTFIFGVKENNYLGKGLIVSLKCEFWISYDISVTT